MNEWKSERMMKLLNIWRELVFKVGKQEKGMEGGCPDGMKKSLKEKLVRFVLNYFTVMPSIGKGEQKEDIFPTGTSESD